MRPTRQATKLDPSQGTSFSAKPRSRRESPPKIFAPRPTSQGPVSRLQELIETRSPSAAKSPLAKRSAKSEIQFSHVVVPPERRAEVAGSDRRESKGRRHAAARSRPVLTKSVAESESDESTSFSTKSVPNLADDRTCDDRRHVSALRLIDSTNLSISLPFDLNEAPKPCEVTEYDDIFQLDQNVLERSEKRSLANNALRYRSSIRIMVRPESGLPAHPETSGGLKSGVTGAPRSIVKEQFR
jgi:hypothetical protein